jgi:hypothetical protein
MKLHRLLQKCSFFLDLTGRSRPAAALNTDPPAAEMRKMGCPGGGVECGIMQPAIHQLSQKVDVPNYASSALSDSKGIFL